VLVALGLGALGVLFALVRFAQRSPRRWLVVAVAVAAGVLVGGAGTLWLAAAIGGAIKG
jgi:hypothetical protein